MIRPGSPPLYYQTTAVILKIKYNIIAKCTLNLHLHTFLIIVERIYLCVIIKYGNIIYYRNVLIMKNVLKKVKHDFVDVIFLASANKLLL